MEVLLTEQFEQAFGLLTAAERQSVRKAVTLLGGNPRHPGLRVKKMQGTQGIWEARASRSIRMTFQMAGDVIVLRNVGEHDRVLRNS